VREETRGMLSTGTFLFLLLALGIAFAFEACNGFHDTANAVATVIYTKSLRPQVAVIWSGLMNFSGVMLGGIAVAFSIVHLLPVDLLVHIDTSAGMAMVIALLLAAITWNFGTWYLAIPASSSHTLIGAIIGVGLMNSWLEGHFGAGVNWKKAGEVGLSLLISPIIGFCLSALLLLVFKLLVKSPEMHSPPQGDKPPPWWVRGILILTCTGVSFAHGSNDGQKGIGLIMLILIGLVPLHFALNMEQSPEQFHAVVKATGNIQGILREPHVRDALAAARLRAEPVLLAQGLREDSPANAVTDLPAQYGLGDPDLASVDELLSGLRSDLEGKKTPGDLDPDTRWQVRTKTLLVEQGLNKLQQRMLPVLSEQKAEILNQSRSELRGAIEYAPFWVIAGVALALGVGTMVGWKRIVVTVGEKIGKTHLAYSQGASAELVAMTTIGAADVLGLPVSTTHVLSSGVAGTMAANRSGLQLATIRSIALAWVLTLPAGMLLAALLFWLFRQIF
jgi:PiT family inorganic phosphate transporter